jgi:hypothetical protein
VSHDYYATAWEVHSVPPAGTIPVVLSRGTLLVIAAWTGVPSNRVPDVAVHTSRSFGVAPSEWQRRRDGRLETRRIAPGRHFVFLEHDSAELGHLSSPFHEFVVEPERPTEIELELRPERRLEGRLQDDVPRPIERGEVVVVPLWPCGWPGGEPARGDRCVAPIQPGGSFTLEHVPQVEVQIVAACRGWASKLEVLSCPARAAEPAIDARLEWTGQRVDLRTHRDAITIAMEPTASFEVRLLTPAGLPLENTVAWLKPSRLEGNENFVGHYGHYRRLFAVAGPDGVALIDAIPAGQYELGASDTIGAFSSNYDLLAEGAIPLEDAGSGDRSSVALEPGERFTETYTLERKRDD